MIGLLAVVAVALLAAPHLLPVERLPPRSAAAVWLAALWSRATIVIAGVMVIAGALPGSEAFRRLSALCLHLIPQAIGHLSVSGHDVGDVTRAAPAAALTLLVATRLTRVALQARILSRRVRSVLREGGPQASLILPEPRVVLAAFGLARPRILISSGALVSLDDEELRAALAHERGHIRRGHRFLTVAAEVATTVGALVPGGRRAMSELGYHLERDADEFALAQRADAGALASAICKAAHLVPLPAATSLLAGAGGNGQVALRIARLVGRGPARMRPALGLMAGVLPALMLVLLVVLGLFLLSDVAWAAHPLEAGCSSP